VRKAEAVFDRLLRGRQRTPAELSAEESALIKQRLAEDFRQHPPTIGVIGVSGTGKSSTINAMFRTSLLVSHTRAGTKKFQESELHLVANKGVAAGEPIDLVVVDAPGLGEDVRRDPAYLAEYRERLPHCDVILWVMAARNRAVSLDQRYLEELLPFRSRMVFAVNQVDLVHPMDWPAGSPIPGAAMRGHIEEIVADRAERLAGITGGKVSVVPYSAERAYNLEGLFHALISAAPDDRAFVFDLLKGFSYGDFQLT
jgi:hypothetical protein